MKRFNYVVTLFVLLLSFTATAAEQIYFVQTDHLGAPEMLTDENQTIVWQASQDPFANSAPITEQVTFDFRFPGQYFDAESGLFYNWNRYYDAGTGRYVTSDPIGLDGGMNTFGYVGGNPLVYMDPQGLRQVVTIGVSGTAQVGLIPSPFGVGTGFSGGQSVGLSIPDDWTNWKCYQLVWQASAMGGLGVGAFAGVGVEVGASSRDNDAPLPRMSTSNSLAATGNVGAGPSGGVSFGSDGSRPFTEGSIGGGRLGVGLGLGVLVGPKTTTTVVLIDTFGDDCECQ